MGRSRTALAGQSIEMTWSPYSSLEPSIVDARIQRSLQLPSDVRMAVDQGAIKLSGHADRGWVEAMTAALQLVPGVRSVDTSQVSQRTPPTNGCSTPCTTNRDMW